MTPIELIRQSLLKTGITLSETIYAEDVLQAFTHLNMMIAQWNRKRFLLYSLIDVRFDCTGQQFYTIGPGQDIDTARPDKIESAQVELLNNSAGPTGNITWALQVLQSREDYSNMISMKELGSIPVMVWYDSQFPYGKIYPWPVPQGGGLYAIHLQLKNQLTQFDDLTTDINLPPEYLDCLMWNLAARIAMTPNPIVIAEAAKSLNTLRGANSQLSHLKMPFGMPGMGNGAYPYHGVKNSGYF